MNGENMLWEKCCKNTEVTKTPHVLVVNMSFCLFLSQNNSFYCTKTQKMQNQNGHCLVKMTRYEK